MLWRLNISYLLGVFLFLQISQAMAQKNISKVGIPITGEGYFRRVTLNNWLCPTAAITTNFVP